MIKATTTTILILFCTISWSQAPLGTINTKWTYEGWSEGSGWLPNWEGNCEGNEVLFEVTGEVVVGGKTCGVVTSNKDDESLTIYQEGDIVYFYEDSLFYKLYDYSATIGDTILSFRPSNASSFSYDPYFLEPTPFEKPDSIYTIILDHDTTTINGIELKRWKTEPIYLYEENYSISDFGTIIENVGSLNGITGMNGIFLATGCHAGFVCYESEGFLLGSNFFPKCDFTSSIIEPKKTEINIYPNPTQDIFNIEAFDLDIEKIEVLDINGKHLLSTSDVNIDLSQYVAGIYLVAIIDSHNQSIVKRIIKY